MNAAPKKATITVNHPLRLEGDRVYLINHGFAPEVTIRMPDGSVRHDVQAFIPTEASTLLSEGAFKQPGKTDAKQDIGIEGLFAPTPVDDGQRADPVDLAAGVATRCCRSTCTSATSTGRARRSRSTRSTTRR